MNYWTIAKIKLYWALNKYRDEDYIPRNKIEFNYELQEDDLSKELKEISGFFGIKISLNKKELNKIISGKNDDFIQWNKRLSGDKSTGKGVAKQIKKELDELGVLKNKLLFDFEKYDYLLHKYFENDYGNHTIWDGLVIRPKVSNALEKISEELDGFLKIMNYSETVSVYKHKILDFKSNEKECFFEEIFDENYFTEYGDEMKKILGAFLILESDKKIQINNFYCSFYNGSDLKDIIIDFENLERQRKNLSLSKEEKIRIKNIRLDKDNYLLEINNGEKIISFKSKKKGEGLEKETKQFKILYPLWDFRWELKDGRVLKKGDFASLDNLTKGCGSESTEAAYKHIQRLNNRFKSEGVAIEITGENKKYRLIINKS